MTPRIQRTVSFFWVLASMFALLAFSTSADKKQPPSRPIDLNAATVKELQKLPGIGPVTAKAIVQFRQKSGPFHRVEDLLAVRGISEGKLSHIRAYVIVSAATKPTPAPTRPTKP